MTAFRSPVDKLVNLADVNTTGAVDGQTLTKSGLTWLPSSVVKSSTVGVVADAPSGGDDSSALQAKITAAAALAGTNISSAEVWLPPNATSYYNARGLILPGNVVLRGRGTRINANGPGPIITCQGNWNGVDDLYLIGGGAGVGANGIIIDDGSKYNRITRCWFDQFDGRALLIKSGGLTVGNFISKLVAQNCLLNTAALTAHTGVLEIGGTDNWAEDCEITASRTSAVSSTNLYAVAIAITGANHFVRDLIGEISDIGFYITATELRAHGLRADLNRGHGFKINGGGGSLIGCHSISNSQDGNGAYKGFWATSTASNFHFIGCKNTSNTPSVLPSYGFLDEGNSFQNFNVYIGCRSNAHTAWGFFAADYAGGVWEDIPQGVSPITVGVTTFNVDQLKYLSFANTGTVTFTNFIGGRPGKRITVIGDGFTTIQNNATIQTLTGGDIPTQTNRAYSFLFNNGVWIQDGAPTAEAVTAPTLLNSWVNYGSGYEAAGYWKDSSGIVHIRGLIKTGTPPSVAFTLPAGYRPANQEIFATIASATTGDIRISTTGDVLINTGSSTFTSLGGVKFRSA